MSKEVEMSDAVPSKVPLGWFAFVYGPCWPLALVAAVAALLAGSTTVAWIAVVLVAHFPLVELVPQLLVWWVRWALGRVRLRDLPEAPVRIYLVSGPP